MYLSSGILDITPLEAHLKIYIASFYDTRARLLPLVPKLQKLGHQVVSTWLWEPQQTTLTPEDSVKIAWRDRQEVARAELLLVDTLDITPRGGREWEYGYASGLDIPVWIIGPKRNVFHYIAQNNFDTWEECLDALCYTT